MIKRTHESKTMTKHISCKCRCKFDGRKCNSNQKWTTINVHVSAKIQENNKHLESIIDDSVIMCDETIDALWSEPTKTMPINFNNKKVTYTMNNFYIIIAFLLITILLLIIVGIYY